MLAAHELVKIWEVATSKPLWEKAVLMLAPAYPDEPLANLASLSLGQRNARLFRLREELFGLILNAKSQCPSCTEAIEFQLDSQVICNESIAPNTEKKLCFTIENYELECRAINSYDLRDLLPMLKFENPENTELELIMNCIYSLKKDKVPQPIESLPMELIPKISEELKNLDSHSEIICRLNCPECDHSWPETFDIAQFLWHEIEMKAQIILSEVQLLAKAFGWWEGDILSLSDVRRKYYLDVVNE